MIWLSPMAGTAEGSVYFDIREISLQQSKHGNEGLIRGLLGDGHQEVWGEVQLGRDPLVRVLPLWSDEGQVENLTTTVDEELLKKQLLAAVQRLFSKVAVWSLGNRTNDNNFFKSDPEERRWFAA